MKKSNKNLTNQVYVYSVDTSAFYNNGEEAIHEKQLEAYNVKKNIQKEFRKAMKECKFKWKIEFKKIENSPVVKRIDKKKKRKLSVIPFGKFTKQQLKVLHSIKKEEKAATKVVNKLKKQIKGVLGKNKGGKRILREDALKTNNVIGLFESTLTRTLGIKSDEPTTDIIIVRAYYFDVLQDIVLNGFVNEDGEEYCFFSASAGQIRNKKAVMIKKTVWEANEKSLTCGLSREDINAQDGMNTTKYLAYLALANSSTTLWKEFNIDRAIVVDDMTTVINAEVDHIDHANQFEITRKEMPVEIEHTDGCGMILCKKSKTAFMTRLPFVKGLLIPTPFDEFAKKAKSTKVIDIYGKEWDVIVDKIEVIFCKSQFKMAKYYSSWKEYQDNFKKYKCEAAKLNEEEKNIRDAKLNYQMIQTLTTMTESELIKLAQPTLNDINEIASNKETMLRLLGADETNERKNSFQEALSMYPELLNDKHAKKAIQNKKASLVKDAKAGKLNVQGKYTFVSPDVYAFCDYLFNGNKNPKGLLANEEVYCNLYGEQTLDLLRSPHLYKEHALRQNVLSDVDGIKKSDWFVSNAVYTSNKDIISKILQFDVDGDKLLVCSDKTVIDVAKRDMEGVVPLYYTMAKAEAKPITNETIYNSMIKAYGANIGEISNKLTKIFNSKDIDLKIAKILTCYNNFIIDFAKTGFKPDIPEHIEAKIADYHEMKAPHFFKYAKDKESHQIEPLNDSIVNKLENIIEAKRLNFRKVVGKFDYKMLMKVKSRKLDEAILERYTELDQNKKILMGENEEIKSHDKLYIYVYIREELLKLNSDPFYIADVLVNHLYKVKDSEFKTTLWESFGEELVTNLKKNVGKTEICEDCEGRFEVTKQRQVRCPKCAAKRKKILNKESQQKSRKNKKAVS